MQFNRLELHNETKSVLQKKEKFSDFLSNSRIQEWTAQIFNIATVSIQA